MDSVVQRRPERGTSCDNNYKLYCGWGNGVPQVDAAGVGVDSQGRVFVLTRSDEQLVTVLDQDGNRTSTWSPGMSGRAHALFVGPGDDIYCVDDQGHAVRKLTPEGRLLFEITTADRPADTGYVPGQPVLRSGQPFNLPTGVAVAPEGDLIVSDGYGNARIHRFTADGKLIHSFGQPGHGPGEFNLPHGVAVDPEGRIYVADRENNRVQIFEPAGKYVTEWPSPRASSIAIDENLVVYVTEMGQVMQGPIGNKFVDRDGARPKITVRAMDGEILTELLPREPEGDGLFFAPHSIAVDASGNVYVSEVSTSYSGGLAASDRPRLHKYERILG